MDKFSSGIMVRPNEHTTLVLSIHNSLSCLVFKTVYIYSWDGGTPILIAMNNYFVAPNGCNEIHIELVSDHYGELCNVSKFEVVYEPCDKNVTLNISTI